MLQEVQTIEAEELDAFASFLDVQQHAMVAKRAIGRAASQAASEGRYEEADDLTRLCLGITQVVNNLRDLV